MVICQMKGNINKNFNDIIQNQEQRGKFSYSYCTRKINQILRDGFNSF